MWPDAGRCSFLFLSSELVIYSIMASKPSISHRFSACCFICWLRGCSKHIRGYFVTRRSILYRKWLQKINIPHIPPHMMYVWASPTGTWTGSLSVEESHSWSDQQWTWGTTWCSRYTSCMDINNLHSRDVTSAPRLVLLTDGRCERVTVADEAPWAPPVALQPQLSVAGLPGSHDLKPASADPVTGRN